jgi:hypothetical protein
VGLIEDFCKLKYCMDLHWQDPGWETKWSYQKQFKESKAWQVLFEWIGVE